MLMARGTWTFTRRSGPWGRCLMRKQHTPDARPATTFGPLRLPLVLVGGEWTR